MLIKCPECGGNVSDKAPACIHCGFPLNDIHKENIQRFNNPKVFDNVNCPEGGQKYLSVTTKITRSICEHFNWWGKNNNTYLVFKFITTCIDHNFQYFEFNTADIPDPNIVRCPKCGSTSVTTEERGYSIMWGVLGSTKKKNLCQKCGYTWWPGAGK